MSVEKKPGESATIIQFPSQLERKKRHAAKANMTVAERRAVYAARRRRRGGS